MCGIGGYFTLDRNSKIEPEILVHMAAIQHHRGPDGYGYRILPGVGFAHARLSINDLRESANQPFTSDGDKLMMTHNGEFYDFSRIRADLTARGARFRTKSDSEIVMHLYPRKGIDETLKHLRGEFAFGLFDAEKDRLMLVRDRFGIKPLYYVNTGRNIVFGSEIKVLFAHPDVRRAFSSQGVYHQLMQTIIPGSTPFEGVKQVRPGHIITFERGGGTFRMTDRAYWDMPFPYEKDRPAQYDENEYIELVRAKLLEAVQLRMIADVPVGCYLSGGIDSCSILGLFSAARQEPVKAFTIGFDNDEYDESDIARQMARSVGADQDIMMLSADHLYDHFVETHWHTERTIYNTLGVAKLLMSRHVHKAEYKVVVTGEGSDELFAGYPAFRRDMFLHGLDHLPADQRREWEKMLHESNELFRGAMLAETTFDDPALDAALGFTPSCLQPWLLSAQRVPGILADSLRSELKDYSPGAAIAESINTEAVRGRHPLDVAQYVWIKTMLEGQILTWGGDRVDMANSMEARPAFLDHHLAEAACTVPPELRIKGRVEKYVLREAMKGLLPRVLYEREKFAFMAPPAHTDINKMNAMLSLASDFLSSDAIRNAGILNEDGVRNLMNTFQDRDTPATTQVQLDAIINHMLGVQIIHRNMIETDIPALAKKKAEDYGWKVYAQPEV